jgi:hypothetical protein
MVQQAQRHCLEQCFRADDDDVDDVKKAHIKKKKSFNR